MQDLDFNFFGGNKTETQFIEDDFNYGVLEELLTGNLNENEISPSMITIYGTVNSIKDINVIDHKVLLDCYNCGTKFGDLMIFVFTGKKDDFKYIKTDVVQSIDGLERLREDKLTFIASIILFLITSKITTNDGQKLPKFLRLLCKGDRYTNFNKYSEKLSSINLEEYFEKNARYWIDKINFPERLFRRLKLGISGHRHVKALITYKNKMNYKSPDLVDFVANFGKLDITGQYLELHHGMKSIDVVEAGSINSVIDYLMTTIRDKAVRDQIIARKVLYKIESNLTVEEVNIIAKKLNGIFGKIASSKFEFANEKRSVGKDENINGNKEDENNGKPAIEEVSDEE